VSLLFITGFLLTQDFRLSEAGRWEPTEDLNRMVWHQGWV